jgi:hypothetical protein
VKIKAGTYTHTQNTAWVNPLVVRRMPSQRGRTVTMSHRWNINFFLYGNTTAELNTKVSDLKAAYANITGDVVMTDNNDVETTHKIPYNQTLNGIRATLVWPSGWIGSPTGTNWTTHVYGIAQIEADTLAVEDNILLYHQTHQFSLGGVGYRVVEAFTGLPQVQLTRQSSKFWAVTKGTGIGAFSNPNPPLPLVGMITDPDRSWVRYGTPKMQGSLQNLAFETSWQYYYESPGPLNAIPPQNP